MKHDISKKQVLSAFCLFALCFLGYVATTKHTGPTPSLSGDKIVSAERNTLIQKHFNPWGGGHKTLNKMIKSNMDTPSSFEHIDTKYIDNGDTLTVLTSFFETTKDGKKVKHNVSADVETKTGKVIYINPIKK